MFRDRDLDLDVPLPPQADDLVRDLGLGAVLEGMGGGDDFVREVAATALLHPLSAPEEIRYRQRILADCLAHPELPRELYQLATATLDRKRGIWAPLRGDSPSTSLHYSTDLLAQYVDGLHRLRQLAERYRPQVSSDALTTAFDALGAELDDDFFTEVGDHLDELAFRHGILLSARLGQGLKGTDYVLRRHGDERSWISRILDRPDPGALRFSIPDRDEAGWQGLRALRDEGLARVAGALTQSTDHITAFFVMLRREIAFYVGCLNLVDRLRSKGEPLCVPEPLPPRSQTLACRGLYEPGLSLREKTRVVGNDVTAEGIPLVVVTGANQGGKSTFLRSVGVAQLLMQCGMAVPALSFTASCYPGVFTHYRREEDASMTSGKLDEELARMSGIVDAVAAGSLLLSNESFASTNEREGSEIACRVFRALVAGGVSVIAVTHLYDMAHRLYQQGGRALFLRAERREHAVRTFHLEEGRPLSTSFGHDLYAQVFGAAASTSGQLDAEPAPPPASS